MFLELRNVPESDLLAVGLFASNKNLRNFNPVLRIIGSKDQAVAPDSLAISSLPLSPFQGLHVSPKRIVPHVVYGVADPLLKITRKQGKLLFGLG